ncbi:hypothetical protein IMSHALPRED_004602 [Imshaugia aleurites]|uniref:Uncharacterized protein n=1 Tax=Imshaugia aleurites TaxID=172621 RepID=A0A8H3F7W5_9LECA|nr:hypothetical protein IMSHALPRED_004602 [Imshaugia aleurites]
MKLNTVMTCIGTLVLALTEPAATAGNWAFDPASCNARDLEFLRPEVERATTIGKLAASWYPAFSNPMTSRGRPNFAEALLGYGNTNYARAIFNGGTAPTANYDGQRNAKGIKSLTGETAWAGGQTKGNVVCIPRDVKEDHSTRVP